MSIMQELRGLLRLRALQLLALSSLLTLMAAVAFKGHTTVRDPDIWWHLKVGDWIVEHHTVPYTGIFSRTAATHPWVAYSWTYEVLMSRAYAWFGLVGFALYGGDSCPGGKLCLSIRSHAPARVCDDDPVHGHAHFAFGSPAQRPDPGVVLVTIAFCCLGQRSHPISLRAVRGGVVRRDQPAAAHDDVGRSSLRLASGIHASDPRTHWDSCRQSGRYLHWAVYVSSLPRRTCIFELARALRHDSGAVRSRLQVDYTLRAAPASRGGIFRAGGAKKTGCFQALSVDARQCRRLPHPAGCVVRVHLRGGVYRRFGPQRRPGDAGIEASGTNRSGGSRCAIRISGSGQPGIQLPRSGSHHQPRISGQCRQLSAQQPCSWTSIQRFRLGRLSDLVYAAVSRGGRWAERSLWR